MPYCSSTGKFAGLEDPEADIQSEEVSELTASFEVVLTRNCTDCYSEVGTYDASIETDFEHECPKVDDEDEGDEEAPEFDIIMTNAEVGEYMQTKTRTGKPIPATASSRYRKRLFEVTVTATLRCQRCDAEFDIEASERDIAASSFDAEAH